MPRTRTVHRARRDRTCGFCIALVDDGADQRLWLRPCWLLLIALKYTQQGGVVVRWESRKESDAERWMVSVQDIGPGFQAASSIPMVNQLRDATQEAHEVEDNATASGTSSNQDQPAVTLASQSQTRPLHQQAGEGIGLSIVKGLCDLLDATLELETGTGQGSTFRVTFPAVYHNSAR